MGTETPALLSRAAAKGGLRGGGGPVLKKAAWRAYHGEDTSGRRTVPLCPRIALCQQQPTTGLAASWQEGSAWEGGRGAVDLLLAGGTLDSET